MLTIIGLIVATYAICRLLLIPQEIQAGFGVRPINVQITAGIGITVILLLVWALLAKDSGLPDMPPLR